MVSEIVTKPLGRFLDDETGLNWAQAAQLGLGIALGIGFWTAGQWAWNQGVPQVTAMVSNIRLPGIGGAAPAPAKPSYGPQGCVGCGPEGIRAPIYPLPTFGSNVGNIIS